MYKALAQLISVSSQELTLFKGEEEYQYLLKWLKADIILDEDQSQKVNTPETPHISHSTITQAIETCNRCSDIIEKKRSLGDGSSGVMIILNSPPLMSSFEKQELKADSIVLLKKIISSIQITLTSAYITNMIKCESSNALLKPSTQFQYCSALLAREIEEKQPSIIIVMGDLTPLRKFRKKYIYSSWYEIPHPITMIKNPGLKREAWNTLKLVMDTRKELNN